MTARPEHFALFVTGHRDAVEPGGWFYDPLRDRVVHRPDVAPLARYLDAVLVRRRSAGVVTLYCRSGDAAVDHAVRAYAAARGLVSLPVLRDGWRWGDRAVFRADLDAAARCDAVVWYGGREGDGDPVGIAELLGIPHRVVGSPLMPAADPAA